MANNPKERQQWILDELKLNSSLSYSECWGIYEVKWGIGQTTFDKDWKISSTTFKDYQFKLNEAKDTASIAVEVEAVLKGLKTKIDRLMILQIEVDNCLLDLKKKDLSIYEKTQLRRTIKELQSEISKIEGDYAPAKSDITSGGKQLQAPARLSITLPDGKEIDDFKID